LGVGGLIQAYTQTAQATLRHAHLVEQEIFDILELTYEYQQTALLSYLCEKYAVKVIAARYDEKIYQKLQINRGYSEAFKKELFDKSNGGLKL
jgi:putative IMPACT (imprinted ancient) family translation regulator